MTHKTLHLADRNKYLQSKRDPSLKEREIAHQSQTTKNYLIKNIEHSNLSPGDKRTLCKMVRLVG